MRYREASSILHYFGRCSSQRVAFTYTRDSFNINLQIFPFRSSAYDADLVLHAIRVSDNQQTPWSKHEAGTHLTMIPVAQTVVLTSTGNPPSRDGIYASEFKRRVGTRVLMCIQERPDLQNTRCSLLTPTACIVEKSVSMTSQASPVLYTFA